MAGQDAPNWGRMTSLGLEMAVCVALGVLAGNWFDHRYKSDPWGIVVGSILGIASGAYLLIKEAIRVNKD
jgi:F0F1-type ATP synthase assembly protein I